MLRRCSGSTLGQQMLDLRAEGLQALHLQSTPFLAEADVGEIGLGQLAAQSSHLQSLASFLDLFLAFASCQLVLCQPDGFAGSPLFLDLACLEGFQRPFGRHQPLHALPYRLVFIAQGINTQRRIGRRTREISGQGLLPEVFRWGPLQLIEFIERTELLAESHHQTIQNPLAVAHQQTLRIAAEALLASPRFLLPARFGQLGFGFGARVRPARLLRPSSAPRLLA